MKASIGAENRGFWPSERWAGLGSRWSAIAASQQGQLILWAPVALSIGIGLHFALAWQHQRLAAALLLLGVAIGAMLFRHRMSGHALLLLAALAAAGLARAGWREQAVAGPRLMQDMTVTLDARVLDVTTKYVLLSPLAANRPLPPFASVRLTLPKTAVPLEPGMRLRVRARLMPPQPAVSPAGYDFARYAWFKQIGATGRILGPVTVLGQEPPDTITSWFDRTRERAAQRFQQQIPGEAGKVAAALIVGERNSLSDETTQAMRTSGLAHLLSVSGFHLVMVAGAVFAGTRHMLALSPWLALHWPLKQIAAVAAICAAIAYTLLTGAAYPSLRAMVAIIIAMIGVLAGRSPISLRLVAVVGFLLLIYRPEALLDVSFQLSFMGVAALVAFFDSKQVRLWLAPNEQDGWIRRGLRASFSTLVATFVAEVALAPIAIAHFNQLGIYGLLANVIGVPVTGLILMPLGFLSLVLQPIGLDQIINPLFGFALDKFIAFSLWIAHLPAAQIRVPEIGGVAFALLMFGQVCFILLKGQARWLSGFFVLGGFVAAWMAVPPDIRIAPDGKTVAVRIVSGDLVFPNLRGGKFARKSWLEDEAEASGSAHAFAAVPEASCANDVCFSKIGTSGRTLAILLAGAAPDSCPVADILIDVRRYRGSGQGAACPAPLSIDKRWLRKNGATEISINGTRLRVRTYSATVGDHAWRQ